MRALNCSPSLRWAKNGVENGKREIEQYSSDSGCSLFCFELPKRIIFTYFHTIRAAPSRKSWNMRACRCKIAHILFPTQTYSHGSASNNNNKHRRNEKKKKKKKQMISLCAFVVESLIHFRSMPITFQNRIIQHNPAQLLSFLRFALIWDRNRRRGNRHRCDVICELRSIGTKNKKTHGNHKTSNEHTRHRGTHTHKSAHEKQNK